MKSYKVEIDQYCIHDEREDVEWGSWSTRHDNSLSAVLKDPKYPDINSIHDIGEGENAWVVWVEYSSGDSFGHAERGGVEAVGIFKNRECAEELKQAIEKHDPDRNTSDWTGKYTLKVETSDGQKFEVYTGSWHDYFGGLDEVHVDRVTVG